jgi:hypothetical protein
MLTEVKLLAERFNVEKALIGRETDKLIEKETEKKVEYDY